MSLKLTNFLVVDVEKLELLSTSTKYRYRIDVSFLAGQVQSSVRSVEHEVTGSRDVAYPRPA